YVTPNPEEINRFPLQRPRPGTGFRSAHSKTKMPRQPRFPLHRAKKNTPPTIAGGLIKIVVPAISVSAVAVSAPKAEPKETAQHDQQNNDRHNPFPAE